MLVTATQSHHALFGGMGLQAFVRESQWLQAANYAPTT